MKGLVVRAGGHDGHFLGGESTAQAIGGGVRGESAVVIARTVAEAVTAPVESQKWCKEKIRLLRRAVRMGGAKSADDHGGLRMPVPKNQRLASFGRFREGEAVATRMQSVEQGAEIDFIGKGPEASDDGADGNADLLEHDRSEAGARIGADHRRTTGEAGGAEGGFYGAEFGFINGSGHKGELSRISAHVPRLKPMPGVG